jgi:hypothetical protein
MLPQYEIGVYMLRAALAAFFLSNNVNSIVTDRVER